MDRTTACGCVVVGCFKDVCVCVCVCTSNEYTGCLQSDECVCVCVGGCSSDRSAVDQLVDELVIVNLTGAVRLHVLQQQIHLRERE
jgi:hypothetical protein